MTLQSSEAVRNARLDAMESVVGTGAIMKLRTGPVPATCATADAGTVISEIALGSDWMNPASGGTKTKNGTWQDTNADNGGTIAHFRIYASDGTTCHHQGTVTLTGGGGDLTLDAVVVTAGQTITITGFTFTAGGA